MRPTDKMTEMRIITRQPMLPPRGRIRTGLMVDLQGWCRTLPVRLAEGFGPSPV